MRFIKYLILIFIITEKVFSFQIIKELRDGKLIERAKDFHSYSGTHIFSNKELIKEFEENTKRLYPEIYEEMRVFRNSVSLKKTAAIGDSTRFFAFNLPKRIFYVLSAELRGSGKKVNIWIEKTELENNHITDSVVQDMIEAFEKSTPNSRNPSVGIIDVEEEYLGVPPNVDGDGKTDILVLDIQDGWAAGAYMAGYFSQIDQLTDNDNSNKRDIIYVDSYPSIYNGPDNYNSKAAQETVSHEFQHLIHYKYDKDEETWINEGLSVYAQYLCGFDVDNVSDYMADTNRDLTEIISNLEGTINNEVIKDYHKVGLFTFYLWEQYGDEFIKTLVQSNRKGLEGINDALRSISVNETFQDILINFALANYINDRTVDEKYGYLNEQKEIKALLHEEHFQYPVKNEDIDLKEYAYKYIQFSSADSLKIKFEGNGITVKAIEYGADFVRLKDVEPGVVFKEDEFGESIYKVVFVIINNTRSKTTFSYDGTAIQSLLVQELKYDDGQPDPFSGEAYFLGFGDFAPGYGWAVKFNLIASAAKILDASMYIYSPNQDDFEFHIWDNTGFNNTPGENVITPITITPPARGQEMWYTVDLTPYENELTNLSGSFYAGVVQPALGSIYLGLDNSNPFLNNTWALFGPSSVTSGWYPMENLAIFDIMEDDTTKKSLAGFNMMFRVKMSVDVREIPPIPPKGLAGVARPSEVDLSWSPNNEWDVSYYNIYRNTEKNFAPSHYDFTGKTTHPKATFVDKSVQNGEVYFYKITAVDIDEKESFPSKVVNVSPPLPGENMPDSTSLALWHFNEGKGAVIYDETLNDKDGNISNPGWISNGRFGNALTFDGRFTAVEGGKLKIGSNNESFTVEMWYRLTEGYQDEEMIFITQGHRRKTEGKWYLKYSSSSRMLEGYIESVNGVDASAVTNKGLDAGVWHHAALVRDAENDKFKLYIDNELAGQSDFSGVLDISNDYDLLIGKDARIIDYVRLSNFYGDIDEIRISNIAINDFDITTEIVETEHPAMLPENYNLYQNYPNPFNMSTKINFDLPKRNFLTLKLYNILGQVVRVLKNEVLDIGRHTVSWDGKNDEGIVLPSGIYFYELRTKEYAKIKKLIMLK